MHSLKENKRIGEIPARASRSMNIDRKKSYETPPGPHVPWTLIEKSYETPPGPHVPWTLIEKKVRNAARASRSMKIDRFWKVLGSLKRVIERSIMEFRQCVCFPSENAFENFDDNTDHPWQDAFSEGKQTHWWNSRHASRSMNIDRKKSYETPPGPHVPWTLIEKSYETPPGPHVPWKSIDFEKSWDHWKEW